MKTSEWSQMQKTTYCMIPFVWNTPKQAHPWIQKVDWWLPGAGGNGEWRETATAYEVSFGRGDETVLKLDAGDSCTELQAHFKGKFMVCEWCSKKL